MRPSVRRLKIIILSFTTSLASPLSQQKRYEMLYSTQTRRDDLLFTSLIDLLFSSYYQWLEAGYFSLANFNILCLWPNWYCANKLWVSFSLPKQIFVQNKIFTTVSRTPFDPKCRYNQHKVRVPLRGFKKTGLQCWKDRILFAPAGWTQKEERQR